MKNNAVENFSQGYSCSESVVKAAIDKGLVSRELLPCATSFSGGMGSGCLCGAIAGAQMVIGCLEGKDDSGRNGLDARKHAKELVEEFKTRNNATCCKVLTRGFDMGSAERKNHCKKMVEDAAEILTSILELDKEKV